MNRPPDWISLPATWVVSRGAYLTALKTADWVSAHSYISVPGSSASARGHWLSPGRPRPRTWRGRTCWVPSQPPPPLSACTRIYSRSSRSDSATHTATQRPLSCRSRRGRGRSGTRAAASRCQRSRHLASCRSGFCCGWWRALGKRRTQGSTLSHLRGRSVLSGLSRAGSGNLGLGNLAAYHVTGLSPLDKEQLYWDSAVQFLD